MAKIRVYEIAKELNIESKALVVMLQGMGVEVKSHASAFEKEEGEEIMERIRAQQRASVVEKRVSTGVIRRRSQPVAQSANEEEAEITESMDEGGAPSSNSAWRHSEFEERLEELPEEEMEETQEVYVEENVEAFEPQEAQAEAEESEEPGEAHAASAGTLPEADQDMATAEPDTAPVDEEPGYVSALAVEDLREPGRHGVTSATAQPAMKSEGASAAVVEHPGTPHRPAAAPHTPPVYGPVARALPGATTENPGQTSPRREEKAYPYRAQVIRRAVPVPVAYRPAHKRPMQQQPLHPQQQQPQQQQQQRQPAAPGGEAVAFVEEGVRSSKPTGIRVLKVVPGKAGRGNEFIDVSKQPGRTKKPPSKQDKEDLRDQMMDAFSSSYVPGFSRRRRLVRKVGKKTSVTISRATKRVIRMETKTILVSELAKKMGVKQVEVAGKLRDLGQTIENLWTDIPLDLATAVMVGLEFEHEVQDTTFKEESILRQTEEGIPEDIESRPPVVTVMGHVDHGKTSILDAIRKTNVTASEDGGITQHIGAYEVMLPKGSITFIDTPGHEAFTAMRARGASVTDIVVLVVAAEDGIMPQTTEAIHHAQEAKVPIIVAVNKMDLPGAKSDRIKQSLTEYHLVPEEWGGDTIIVEVSAKTKTGIKELLDSILIQAEVLELKGNPKKPASGTIIEARLDRGRGPVATVLVKDGTLRRGDVVVVGTASGKVRNMFDHEGKNVDVVTPGRPVQVQGLDEVPGAGDLFNVVANDREAKRIVDHRVEELRASKSGQTARLNLADFYEKLQGVEKLELKVVVKADVQGTAEAVKQAVEKQSTEKVSVKVIHYGVGAINETDVNLALASGAVLVGFHTRPDTNAKKVAQTADMDIKTYRVIYDLTEDIRKAQTGLLPATIKENVIGQAEVRELFNVPKVGTIAGTSVISGKMLRGAKVRLLRDSVQVHLGRMNSLKRFKEDVREVATGYECGIGLESFNDIKRGDIIEAYVIEEIRPSL